MYNSWSYYGQANNRRTEDSKFPSVMQPQPQPPLQQAPGESTLVNYGQQPQGSPSQRQGGEGQRVIEDQFRKEVSSIPQPGQQQQQHQHQQFPDGYFQSSYQGQNLANSIPGLTNRSHTLQVQPLGPLPSQISMSTAPTTYSLTQVQSNQSTVASSLPGYIGQTRPYYSQSQQSLLNQPHRSLGYYTHDLQQSPPTSQRYESPIDQSHQSHLQYQQDPRILNYNRTLQYPLEHQRTPSYLQSGMGYGQNFIAGRSSLDGTANASELSTLDLTPQFEQVDGNVSGSSNNYKPPQPKNNTRPRIHKLSADRYLVKNNVRKPTFKLGEYSTKELKEIFFNHVKITIDDSERSFYFENKIKTDFERQMFEYFCNSLSQSLDVYFDKKIYGEIVSEIAIYEDTDIIVNAIYCLSSLMLHRITPDKVDPSLPIKYYQESVKIMKYHLESETLEDGIASRCLLAATLLCLYEFFFSSIQGVYADNATNMLASIIGAKTRNKASPLLDSLFLGTCFWAIFLMGYIKALKNGHVNAYSVELFWNSLDSEYFKIFDKYLLSRENEVKTEIVTNMETVWWFRKTILNCSKIADFRNEIQVLTKEEFESNQSLTKWVELKNMIINFEERILSALEPIIYKPNKDGSSCFPLVYYKDELSALIGLNRMLAKILLFETLMIKTNIHSQLVQHQLARFPPGYCKRLAMDIVGIIQTYDSNLAIWPLNLHIIKHVGHYVHDDPNAGKQLDTLVERMLTVCKLPI